MPIGAIIAAGITAGAGLLGSGLNLFGQNSTNEKNKEIQDSINDTNFAIANMTNETNRQLAYLQNDWNIEQWNRQNAYNHPAAQADRLRAAGLSSAAAAQAVSDVPASSLQSANLANQQIGAPMQAATMMAPQFNLAEIAKTAIEAAGGASQAAKSMKETQLMEEIVATDLDAKRWATQMTIQQYFQNQQSFPYQNRMLQYQADSAYWRSKGDSYLPENMRMANLLQKQTFDQAKWAFDNINPLEIQKMGEEIKNIIEEGKKMRAETANIQADTNNKILQGEGIETDNAIKNEQHFSLKLDNCFKRFGVKDDAAGRMSALIVGGHMTPTDAVKVCKTGVDYLRTAGKVFNADVDTRQYFNYTINPSAFERYKSQSSMRTMWQDFKSEYGLPTSTSDLEDTRNSRYYTPADKQPSSTWQKAYNWYGK